MENSIQSKSARTRFVVKQSKIHGRGVVAARAIKKGERIIEYKGDLIGWKEADRRPSADPDNPHHTFLFALSDGKHVIDGNSNGNAARWINHSCAPNCEAQESDDGRVFIHAVRNIRKGEELNYDYGLIIDERLTPTLKKQHACRCGAKDCRGTMLALKRKSVRSAQ